MLARKEQTKAGKILPQSWSDKVKNVLLKVYQDQCQITGKTFQVHGISYPNEFFMAVSFFDENRLLEAPISYILSLDLKEQQSVEKDLDTLIDSIGLFFDSYFADSNWNDYVATWIEAEYKNIKFHYQVSRENVALTIQADYLLNQ